jgi:FKBP-type peptidyl-prolyl cis-trans isomerase FkpA
MDIKRKLLIALLCVAFVAFAGCGEEGEADPSTAQGDCNTESVETEAGLVYKDVECGEGAEPANGDTISVHYTGRLEDGTEFDSSEGGEPISFVLGAGMVIEGWDLGFEGMKVGGKRELTIPPELGYGEMGSPPTIPPNSTLVFDVELVDVQPADG